MPTAAPHLSRRSLRILVPLMLATVSISSLAHQPGPHAADLSRYRNRNRLLLIFAPSASDSRYARQSASLDGKDAGLTERDVVRFDVFQSGVSRRGGSMLSAEEAGSLRRDFQVEKGRFKILMLDKDGHRAFSADRPATARELFLLIDNTPLRRYEARSRKKSPSGAAFDKIGIGTALLPAHPNKHLTPEQVVKIQMEALQHNDTPAPDAGIATTFDFASPQNKQATGPLDHFALIVKSPAYARMLNCKKITYDPILVEDEKAQQRVHIVAADGSKITYIFMLSLQKDGPFAGCWMNDGCVRDDSDAEQHRFDA